MRLVELQQCLSDDRSQREDVFVLAQIDSLRMVYVLLTAALSRPDALTEFWKRRSTAMSVVGPPPVEPRLTSWKPVMLRVNQGDGMDLDECPAGAAVHGTLVTGSLQPLPLPKVAAVQVPMSLSLNGEPPAPTMTWKVLPGFTWQRIGICCTFTTCS